MKPSNATPKTGFDGNGQLVSRLDGDGQLMQFADTVGVLILGLICILLLLALLRSQKHTRRILERQIEALKKQSR